MLSVSIVTKTFSPCASTCCETVLIFLGDLNHWGHFDLRCCYAQIFGGGNALVTLPTVSFAWNRGGHLTTCAIAYQELKATNPAAVDRIVEIMNSTPTPSLFDGRLAEESTPEAKAERLFMEMATWPDEVRPPSEYSKQFNHDTWHYINFVYVPPGTPDTFTKPDEITADRIYEAFARNAAIVSDPNASNADKAVALCWVPQLPAGGGNPFPEFQIKLDGANAVFV